MKKIFLDANVVIDYLDSSAEDHTNAKECLEIIRRLYKKPFVSPFTFLIVNFIFGNPMKDKQVHKRRMQTFLLALK